MSADARAKLAAQQAELVAALVGHGPAPLGFDVERVNAAAAALALKRRRAVLRAWPGMASALGKRFAERFQAYAQLHPLPQTGGPLMDGRMFVRFLAANEDVPDALLLQAMEVDLYRAPRFLPVLKYVRLRNPRRFVMGFRFPWLGQYILRPK